jgi:phage baseplate assembly protein W
LAGKFPAFFVARARDGATMIDRRSIPFAHWSHKIGRIDPETGLAAPVDGKIVVALEDLEQSISTIVLTPKRSVPTNPLKGCDLAPYIDKHEAIAIPNMTREIWDALAVWEKRLVVDDVRIINVAFSHWVSRIFWHPVQTILDDIRLAQQTEVVIRA